MVCFLVLVIGTACAYLVPSRNVVGSSWHLIITLLYSNYYECLDLPFCIKLSRSIRPLDDSSNYTVAIASLFLFCSYVYAMHPRGLRLIIPQALFCFSCISSRSVPVPVFVHRLLLSGHCADNGARDSIILYRIRRIVHTCAHAYYAIAIELLLLRTNLKRNQNPGAGPAGPEHPGDT